MTPISKTQIKFIRSLQYKKYRDETGLFVAEGIKCIDELRKGFELKYLVVDNTLTGSCHDDFAIAAKHAELLQMSGLKTPQGAIAVFKKNNTPALQLTTDKTPDRSTDRLILVLDGIQDPGNLGTIIRTCDWFGVRRIICSNNTADCFNPKVVQATMGALARVKLIYTDLVPFLQAEKDNGNNIFGTLLEGKNMYQVLKEHPLTANPSPLTVIVMGNEGNGISPAVRQFITHPLRIPSYPDGDETSESLNVAIATAIVLAEFRKTHTTKFATL